MIRQLQATATLRFIRDQAKYALPLWVISETASMYQITKCIAKSNSYTVNDIVSEKLNLEIDITK